MTAAKYNTREHKNQRRHWARIIAQGEGYCAEPICLMEERWIEPGTPWHVCHDPTGTHYIGPGHQRCNTTEAATRQNNERKPKSSRSW